MIHYAQADAEQNEAQELQQLVGNEVRPPKQQQKRARQPAKRGRGRPAMSSTAETTSEEHDLPTSWTSREGVHYAWAAGPKTNEERGDVTVDKNLLKKGSVVW